MVAGPLIVRITDANTQDRPVLRQYRYVLMFRVNQVVTQRTDGTDPWRSSRGNFTVLDAPPFDFMQTPRQFGGRDGCLAIVILGPGRVLIENDTRALDKVRIGERVRVRLQPLTRDAGGKAMLAKKHISYPRLRSADLHFRGKGIRRELKRIGCKNRPLPTTL